MNKYYVYILTNKVNGTLYVGVTNDLLRRIYQHKNSTKPTFTLKYGVNLLVYFEESNDINVAIEREKQIKSWKRKKKIALIEEYNPSWQDLSALFSAL